MAKVCKWDACHQSFTQLEDLLRHVDIHIEKAQPRSVGDAPQRSKRKLSEAMITPEAKERWKRNNLTTLEAIIQQTEEQDNAIKAEPIASVKTTNISQDPSEPSHAIARICTKCGRHISNFPIECDVCHRNCCAACNAGPAPDKIFICTDCSQKLEEELSQ